jgi:hypothetical protein
MGYCNNYVFLTKQPCGHTVDSLLHHCTSLGILVCWPQLDRVLSNDCMHANNTKAKFTGGNEKPMEFPMMISNSVL